MLLFVSAFECAIENPPSQRSKDRNKTQKYCTYLIKLIVKIICQNDSEIGFDNLTMMKRMSKTAKAMRSWLKVCFLMSLVAKIPIEAKLATRPTWRAKKTFWLLRCFSPSFSIYLTPHKLTLCHSLTLLHTFTVWMLLCTSFTICPMLLQSHSSALSHIGFDTE